MYHSAVSSILDIWEITLVYVVLQYLVAWLYSASVAYTTSYARHTAKNFKLNLLSTFFFGGGRGEGHVYIHVHGTCENVQHSYLRHLGI